MLLIQNLDVVNSKLFFIFVLIINKLWQYIEK